MNLALLRCVSAKKELLPTEVRVGSMKEPRTQRNLFSHLCKAFFGSRSCPALKQRIPAGKDHSPPGEWGVRGVLGGVFNLGR